MSADEPRHVGQALDRLAAELRLGDLREGADLHSVWDAVVGEEVAAHARPVRLREGVLVVAVDEPGWATRIRYLGAELAGRLNERLGSHAVTSFRPVVRGREAR